MSTSSLQVRQKNGTRGMGRGKRVKKGGERRRDKKRNGKGNAIDFSYSFLRLHREDIETLFQLLKAFLNRHITSFLFLKSYLENTVAKDYTIEHRRAVFFKFVEIFSQPDYPQDLKAKVHCMPLIVSTTQFHGFVVSDIAADNDSYVYNIIRRGAVR